MFKLNNSHNPSNLINKTIFLNLKVKMIKMNKKCKNSRHKTHKKVNKIA